MFMTSNFLEAKDLYFAQSSNLTGGKVKSPPNSKTKQKHRNDLASRKSYYGMMLMYLDYRTEVKEMNEKAFYSLFFLVIILYIYYYSYTWQYVWCSKGEIFLIATFSLFLVSQAWTTVPYAPSPRNFTDLYLGPICIQKTFYIYTS